MTVARASKPLHHDPIPASYVENGLIIVHLQKRLSRFIHSSVLMAHHVHDETAPDSAWIGKLLCYVLVKTHLL